jgi:probable DNA metabolism protein
VTELVRLPLIGAVAAWRREARRLAGLGVPADAVLWQVGDGQGGDLFAAAPAQKGEARAISRPQAAVRTLESALHHSDPQRFARGYGLLLRLAEGAVAWGDRSDAAMRAILDMDKAVRRDVHKMHAFVRFRELESAVARRRFAAWFEPEHPVTELAAPFFARRFGDMDWVIATPGLTARFEGGELDFLPPSPRERIGEDATEDLWRAYYASIFNPARVKLQAMRSEMPKKYWKNLPEAGLIPELVRGAQSRVEQMARQAMDQPAPAHAAAIARARAARMISVPQGGLAAARAAAARCRNCPLHVCATQTVWGEGPETAALMLVGEQPGDQEDLAGRPFMGPAGEVLNTALTTAGLDRANIYVTNAVKHFKFVPRGRRRLHRRPEADEIAACRPWLETEIAAIRPRMIVALGATAAESLTGSGKSLLARQGATEPGPHGIPVLITLHPAYILRLPDATAAREARSGLARDLGRAGAAVFSGIAADG